MLFGGLNPSNSYPLGTSVAKERRIGKRRASLYGCGNLIGCEAFQYMAGVE